MPNIKYDDYLIKSLKNKKEAAAYLTACFDDSEEVFLLGLRNVVEANGGVSTMAKTTELNRENLYKILSEDGNPKLSSLSNILKALGLKISIKDIREVV